MAVVVSENAAGLTIAGIGLAVSGGAAVVPEIIMVPNFQAMLVYGGWGSSTAIVISMLRVDVRDIRSMLIMGAFGFLVGAAAGVSIAEVRAQPNVALGVTTIASLLLPQFVAKPIETIRQIKDLIWPDKNGPKA